MLPLSAATSCPDWGLCCSPPGEQAVLPVEMVSFYFMLYILATMTKTGNSFNVDTSIFKDLTGECWGVGKIEDKLVFNENRFYMSSYYLLEATIESMLQTAR